MTKYYYTDPLQVFWMAREFGFKFEIKDNINDLDKKLFANGAGCLLGIVAGSPFVSDKIYICPFCHEMLKLQLHDVIDIGLPSCYGPVFNVVKPREGDFSIYYDMIGEITPWKIIRRNGKAFFMPESE